MSKPTRYTKEMMAQYLKKGYWTQTTWPEVWDQNAKAFPHKEAIVDSKTRLTWSQAKHKIDRLALGLVRLGFQRDDVLVLQLPNSVELCLLRMACDKAGILCLPVITALRQKEMDYILRYVDAVGIVIPLEFRNFDHFRMVQEIRPHLPKLRHIIVTDESAPEGAISVGQILSQPVEDGDPMARLRGLSFRSTEVSWISHTTGTTGFPKFVEIPTSARMVLCKAYAEAWKLTGDDILAALSPHTGGPNIIVYWSAALVGAKVVMMERFEAEAALKLVERERVTAFGFVPALFTKMMTHPNRSKYDLSSVRLWVCAGGAPPYDLAREAEDKIGGQVVQIYGAVDWGGGTCSGLESTQEERLLTSGKLVPNHEIKLVDDSGKEVGKGEIGEVLLRGPAGVAGYYRNPEATWEVWSEDGWYRPGDFARVDKRGNVVIAGRKKDMIKRGGENIYPIEIENLLDTHPHVLSSAIVKMPDPVMGERACAYVVLKPGQGLTFDDMVSFLKQKDMAAFKLPERLEIVEALPMVAGIEKVDKKALEKDILEKLTKFASQRG